MNENIKSKTGWNTHTHTWMCEFPFSRSNFHSNSSTEANTCWTIMKPTFAREITNCSVRISKWYVHVQHAPHHTMQTGMHIFWMWANESRSKPLKSIHSPIDGVCPQTAQSFFSLKTRCKPLSHTCILLILQVCFLALCVRECYMLKGILCVYYHSNELCLKSERERTHKIASPTNPIQSNSDTAKIQPSISSGNEYRMNLFYSVVLWFRYRISKLTSLPHTRTNWNKLIARVNFGPNSLLYLLHWNSRPLIE